MPDCRPISFKPEMVKRILDGSKTQTRRPIKVKHPSDLLGMESAAQLTNGGYVFSNLPEVSQTVIHYYESVKEPGITCKYGKEEDTLWVRNNHSIAHKDTANEQIFDPCTEQVIWKSGEVVKDVKITSKSGFRKRAPQFMPRYASTILLEITDIRVQRLQDISEEDAMKEGFNSRDELLTAWQSMYPKGESNPWVWAITFKRVTEKQ